MMAVVCFIVFITHAILMDRTSAHNLPGSTLNNTLCLDCDVSCRTSGTADTQLVSRLDICDALIQCDDVTPCDVGCSQYYRCHGSSECVERSTICDKNSCNGCSEDTEWQHGIGFECARQGFYCLLPQQLLWDNVKDCDGGEDLCYSAPGVVVGDGRDIRSMHGATLDEGKCFECLDHTMIIPWDKVCDDVMDCSDQSDECLCEARVPSICKFIYNTYAEPNRPDDVALCKLGEVSCGGGVCISRSEVCDSYPQCSDKRDESNEFCDGTIQCQYADQEYAERLCRCDTSFHPCQANIGAACDGVMNCPPPFTGAYNVQTNWNYPEDECKAECDVGVYGCVDGSFSAVSEGVGMIACLTYIDYSNATASLVSHGVTSSRWCDGTLDCSSGQDEYLASCNQTRFFCDVIDGKVSIPLSKVCDGTMDCIGGQDESDCVGRFRCDVLSGTKDSFLPRPFTDTKWLVNLTTLFDNFARSDISERNVSIDYLYVCDYNINCDDGEDEMDCRDGRFYCENKDPLFVMSSKLFNGRGDCSDWSDECPTDMTSEDTFSSRYHLIANPILRVFVWIMGVLAVGGNLIVIVGEVLECKNMKKRDFASLRANHIFVLNLAVADLLMGVYLIILGGVGVLYQGRYCIDKYTWLTSALCSNIGVLVVVSSETSVVTMVILTSFRVYATYNPFSSQLNPRSWLVTLLIALSWLFAVSIATVPFAPSLHHFFIEKAWIKGNPFFKSEMVGLTPAKIFVRRLLSFDSHFGNSTQSLLNQAADSRSWIDLIKVMESDPEGSHYLDIVGYFGYYSDNSVCIPKLYVKHSDAAWGFSLAVSIFNFFSFIYVLVAYFAIYLKSSKSLLLHSKGKQQSMISKKNAAMQRKIIRLIITDFCCWVPISIMAFLSIGGYDIPSVVYSVSAIILLPINSALNPLLYSNFVDKVIDRMKKKPERQVSQSSETLQSTRV